MKHELQSIIFREGKVRNGTLIQTAARYLRGSAGTGKMAKEAKLYKKEETKILKRYISENHFWISDIDLKNYISEGAEQKVYLRDGKNVFKLNDSIFYSSWEDYLNSLLLHNYFFPDTAYELLGFIEKSNDLFAVVKQPFVVATEKTDLQLVKDFMKENGFVNTKNNDYHHPDLGLILEDLHDENVLTKDGVLQFIDTVFYITDRFYKD